MVFHMVGNMASIFTQIYITQVTSIYSFFPHLLHTVPFTSLSLLWVNVDIFIVVFIYSCHDTYVQWGFCLLFSWWQSSKQFNCNLESEVKMTLLLFFVEVLWYKCGHLLCWCLQNDRGCTSMLWLRNSQHHISCVVDHDDLHLHVSVVWLNVLWLIYLDHITTQSPVCVKKNISWVWIWTDKSYKSIFLPNSGHQV